MELFRRKQIVMYDHSIWLLFSTLPHVRSVTLGQLTNPSGPWFICLRNEELVSLCTCLLSMREHTLLGSFTATARLSRREPATLLQGWSNESDTFTFRSGGFVTLFFFVTQQIYTMSLQLITSCKLNFCEAFNTICL